MTLMAMEGSKRWVKPGLVFVDADVILHRGIRQ
jgi:hypothetical protein